MASARVRSPAARRIEFTGVLASPDGYGRLVIGLVDELGGRPDLSWRSLLAAVPPAEGGAVPYEIDDGAFGGRGICRVAVPARRRDYWLAVARELRGLEVRVTAAVRRYRFARGGRQLRGAALDLELLEPAAPPAAAPPAAAPPAAAPPAAAPPAAAPPAPPTFEVPGAEPRT